MVVLQTNTQNSALKKCRAGGWLQDAVDVICHATNPYETTEVVKPASDVDVQAFVNEILIAAEVNMNYRVSIS